jgi:hypothetical protein
MGLKIKNGAYGILASNITAGATTIPLQTGHGARFATLGAGDFELATLINQSNQLEVVKITAIAGDSLTVVRGQDGYTALAFSAGDRIEDRPCAAAMAEFLLKSDFAAYAASVGLIPSTGDVKLTYKTAADTGWVLMNDGSIGNAASGATARANADTEALFTLLWTNVINLWAPLQDDAGVFVARGASAAADFAASRRLVLPKQLGRALAVSGLGSFTSLFTADAGLDRLTIDSNSSLYTGAKFRVSNSGGALPGGLAPATDYYAIRVSATAVQVASSLANAHAGVVINILDAGTGTHTLTMSLVSRALGEHLGEDAHVQTRGELVPHSHPVIDPGHDHTVWDPNGSGVGGTGGGGFGGNVNSSSDVTGITTDNDGNGQPANIMQPSSFMNVMIKL